MVPLFLDGEVSFLPQNSFPCSFQPFEVCWVLGAGVPEQGQGMRMSAQAGSKDCDDMGAVLPPQDGECLEAQRRLVALLMAFVCSLPRNVSWWAAGWRDPDQAAPGCNVLCLLQVAIPQQERLLRELLELSCSCNCPFTATTAAKCFAGLVNKHLAGKGAGQDIVGPCPLLAGEWLSLSLLCPQGSSWMRSSSLP